MLPLEHSAILLTCIKRKIDKTKVLKTNGSLMKVKSIEECSLGAFCNTFDLHYAIIGLENQFWSSFSEWPLKTGFTVNTPINRRYYMNAHVLLNSLN